MVTSIQLNEHVKSALDNLKNNTRETYEEVIVKMMNKLEEQKREKQELLIEGCKVMAEESLKITKEFQTTDSEIDWEWNEN